MFLDRIRNNDNGASLGDELRSLASRLLVLGERLDWHEQRSDRSPPEVSPRTDDGHLLMLAVAEYDARRKREEFVPSDLLAEPAWDILLDLYIRQAQGKPTTISSACVGSVVPATTALRWLATLRARGFVERKGSDDDRRVEYVHLSEAGTLALTRWLRYRSTLAL